MTTTWNASHRRDLAVGCDKSHDRRTEPTLVALDMSANSIIGLPSTGHAFCSTSAL